MIYNLKKCIRTVKLFISDKLLRKRGKQTDYVVQLQTGDYWTEKMVRNNTWAERPGPTT